MNYPDYKKKWNKLRELRKEHYQCYDEARKVRDRMTLHEACHHEHFYWMDQAKTLDAMISMLDT